MTRSTTRWLGRQMLATLLTVAAVTPAAAQLLTLGDALRRAEDRAYANRGARAQAQAEGTHATAALRGILPTLRLEGGYARTTDPIGAFGTALRQRRIEQADFDPARLNHPAATENWIGSVVLEQPVLNPDAWLGRRAAARAGDAARASAEWTRLTTAVDVIRAYYGGVLASEKVATLEAADEAAAAHVRQAETLVKAGLATRSDALLASVKAGEVETQLVEARGDAMLARRQLAVLLDLPPDSTPALPAGLPPAASVRALLAEAEPTAADAGRADVRAAELGLDATRADVLRARSAQLPRLNAFARYDWNSPTSLYAGEANWSVGVMATWTVFSGASDWADRSATSARAEAARAAFDASAAQAGLDVERARNGRRVSLARLDIAERGARQAAEAHRIVGRKYEGGLASVTELLDAAAAETQAGLALAGARYAAIAATAELRRAVGLDPADLAAFLSNSTAGSDR